MIGPSTLDKTIQTPSHIQTPSLIITKKNQVKKHMIAIYYESRVLSNFSCFFGVKKLTIFWTKNKKNIFTETIFSVYYSSIKKRLS
jgi:hypothetical protein